LSQEAPTQVAKSTTGALTVISDSEDHPREKGALTMQQNFYAPERCHGMHGQGKLSVEIFTSGGKVSNPSTMTLRKSMSRVFEKWDKP
jgi:hypothetical protein